MSRMDDIQGCLDREATAEQTAAADADLFAPDGFLAAINAIMITGPQMRAAVETIADLPVRSDADIAEHGRRLAEFARDSGFTPAAEAGAALHARAIAMDRWCQRHDPRGETDIDAFYEAGARAALVATEDGLGFVPERFGDLVQFLTEMPF